MAHAKGSAIRAGLRFIDRRFGEGQSTRVLSELKDRALADEIAAKVIANRTASGATFSANGAAGDDGEEE